MTNTITIQQFETLQYLANRINAEISAYNDENDIVHQLINVSAYETKDNEEHHAYFDITAYRTHSSSEETLTHKAIEKIGKMLVTVGIPDAIRHTGDCSEGYNFGAHYKVG
jgi:adenylate cyclase class IV